MKHPGDSMEIKEFRLGTNEYIELHNLLKVMGLSETGGIAKLMIAEGLVMVDGAVEFRKRCKIRPGQVVRVGDHAVTVK